MADRKLIELIIDEEQENFAVDAISLVKYPAIESDFIFLSKQNRYLSLAQVDEEQRTLIGPALIPEKHIPRYDENNDEEYDVYFSTDTVKRASELFLQQNHANDHTFEHATKIDGVSVVESWLVQDPEVDKSKVYGLSVPKGTWMVRVKVNNEEVWQSVKSGEVKGFSIEGYFVDKVVSMSKNKSKSWLRRTIDKLKPRKFYQEVPLSTGDVLVTEDDKLSAGSLVYTLDEEGNRAELADGSYQTEAGVELTVYQGVLTEYDGEVAAVEKKAEEPKEETTMQKDMLVQYWKKYLTLQYEKKMSKKTTMSKASQAIEKVAIYMEPYDLDYRGHGFWINPFKHRSWDEFQRVLKEMQDGVGPEIEEWELVDTDFIGFRNGETVDGIGMEEEAFDSILELVEWLDDMDITWEEWQAYASYQGEVTQDYAEEAYMGRFDSLLDYAYELIDETGISDDMAETYFDWDGFGLALKANGDLAAMTINDWEDRYDTEEEAQAVYDEMYDWPNTKLAEWYIEDVLGDIQELGKDTMKDFFDYKAFARDLESEYDVIKGIVWWQH